MNRKLTGIPGAALPANLDPRLRRALGAVTDGRNYDPACFDFDTRQRLCLRDEGVRLIVNPDGALGYTEDGRLTLRLKLVKTTSVPQSGTAEPITVNGDTIRIQIMPAVSSLPTFTVGSALSTTQAALITLTEVLEGLIEKQRAAGWIERQSNAG